MKYYYEDDVEAIALSIYKASQNYGTHRLCISLYHTGGGKIKVGLVHTPGTGSMYNVRIDKFMGADDRIGAIAEKIERILYDL